MGRDVGRRRGRWVWKWGDDAREAGRACHADIHSAVGTKPSAGSAGSAPSGRVACSWSERWRMERAAESGMARSEWTRGALARIACTSDVFDWCVWCSELLRASRRARSASGEPSEEQRRGGLERAESILKKTLAEKGDHACGKGDAERGHGIWARRVCGRGARRVVCWSRPWRGCLVVAVVWWSGSCLLVSTVEGVSGGSCGLVVW